MRTNYVLIDYENVQAQSLHLLKDEHFRVMVFLGPANTKLRVDFVLAMHQLGARSSYITLETGGTKTAARALVFRGALQHDQNRHIHNHL